MRRTSADVLAERLTHGPPIILDGGTGTELERKGATMHERAWSARAALTDPEIVRNVHASFLEAGAELIIANTYSANFHIMAVCGLSDEFERANRRALELAKDARRVAPEDSRIWVAGSMSTTTFSSGIDTSVVHAAGDAAAGYRAQAQIIAEAGVDLIVLEMMRDVEQSALCLQAACETGLPVWMGMSAERTEDGQLVLFGSDTPLARGVAQILEVQSSIQAVGVMHSQLEMIPQALKELQSIWNGPLFAYPHHGVFELPHWRFDNTLSPGEFARAAGDWIRAGATAVGGCCGVGPDHIAALRAAVHGIEPD